jgi:hypothetical protein
VYSFDYFCRISLIYVLYNTLCSECLCALRLRYIDLVSVSTLVEITSNIFGKCTANFRTQICRKCLRIKLNGFRPVYTPVDITSNTFYKCTATFRTHCIYQRLQLIFVHRKFITGFNLIRYSYEETKCSTGTVIQVLV